MGSRSRLTAPLLMVVVGALALIGAIRLGQGSATAADVTVNVGAGGQLRFNPNTVNVSVGDTVTFAFQSGTHSAQAVGTAFFSGVQGPGAVYEFTATADATIYYYCTIHATENQATEANVQANSAMVGKIVVGQGGPPPTNTPTATPTNTPTLTPTPSPTATATPSPTATPPTPGDPEAELIVPMVARD